MIAVTLIEVPSWGTATIIEIAYLVSGLLALVISGIHIPRVYGDWKLAVESRRPTLRETGARALEREKLRFLTGALITFVGLSACIQAAPIIQGAPGPTVITPNGLINAGALIIISLLVGSQSALDWRSSQRVMRYLAHDVPTENAILLVNVAGKITYANGVADKVFGRRLVGLDVEDLVPERLRATHRQHRAEYEKNPTTRPMGIDLGTVGVRPDGSEFPIYATLSPFTDETGESRTLMTVKLGDLSPTPN